MATHTRLPTIDCALCEKPMRLVSIVPHPTNPHTDLRSFACDFCDEVQQRAVALPGAPMTYSAPISQSVP